MMATATDIPRYTVHGLALVPIPRGKKGPSNIGWNERQQAVREPAAAERISGGNVGLAHAWCTPSPTCALDIDSYTEAEAWLAAEGIDLTTLLAAEDAVQIRSGREGRAKLLYRLPHIMATKRISRGGVTLLEFRCADAAGLTVQDVLPPSIHPDTGKPYEWGGLGDWRHIPEIPPALWQLWKRIHTLHTGTGGSDQPSGRATIQLPRESMSDIRSALLSIDADDRDVWVRVGHALATLADEAEAFDAWMQWSATSDKFDYQDAGRVWASFQPSSTGPQAIFAEAQRRGWKNPRAREAAPLPEPPPWLDDAPAWDEIDTTADPVAAAEEASTGESRYRLLTGADLDAMAPIRWRVKGVLPSSGIASIYGPSMSGKSFLAFDLACAIAEGSEWFGNRVQQAPVVYVCLEGEAGYKLRAQAWQTHHGRPLPDAIRFVMQPFALTSARDVFDLSNAVAAAVDLGGVAIIDTLNRAAPGMDENSSKDMSAVIEASKALARRIDGLVVLVSHTGKDASKGLRGHSSLIAALDAAIEVTRDGDARTWSTAKVKDGKDSSTEAFRLDVVKLGYDEDGDEVTSCVIAGVTAGENGAAVLRLPQLSFHERTGLRAFDVAEAAEGGADRRGNALGVDVAHWRNAFYGMSTADTYEAKKKSFGRVKDALVDKGYLAVSDGVFRRIRGSDGHL